MPLVVILIVFLGGFMHMQLPLDTQEKVVLFIFAGILLAGILLVFLISALTRGKKRRF